jgi:hypothetical protein
VHHPEQRNQERSAASYATLRVRRRRLWWRHQQPRAASDQRISRTCGFQLSALTFTLLFTSRTFSVARAIEMAFSTWS